MNTSQHGQMQQTKQEAIVYQVDSLKSVTESDRSGSARDSSEPDPETPALTDRLVFTVVEAAYLMNISRAFAYELVARGELPAIRLGRRIVIPRLGLERLLGSESS